MVVSDLVAIAAAIALGLAALGTGIAESQIGAAGVGMVAEDPKKLGLALLFTVIPETILILGFALAIYLLFI
ncbi:MAG: ATPase [Candidatus Parvarchaeota archaeon]|jgi:V/A-type H+-transporting ATPase subunit K|nr:ATPase [Candidatus Parvarchaeota archaeon]